MDAQFAGLAAVPDLHPLVIHFPIAFWLTGTAAWVFSIVRTHDRAWEFGLWLQTLGTVSGWAAVLFGYLAANRLGHEGPSHELVHAHRDLMVVASVVAVMLTALAWRQRGRRRRLRGALVAGSLVLAGVVAVGADKGGALVYQYGIGLAAGEPRQRPGQAEHAPASSPLTDDEHHH